MAPSAVCQRNMTTGDYRRAAIATDAPEVVWQQSAPFSAERWRISRRRFRHAALEHERSAGFPIAATVVFPAWLTCDKRRRFPVGGRFVRASRARTLVSLGLSAISMSCATELPASSDARHRTERRREDSVAQMATSAGSLSVLTREVQIQLVARLELRPLRGESHFNSVGGELGRGDVAVVGLCPFRSSAGSPETARQSGGSQGRCPIVKRSFVFIPD